MKPGREYNKSITNPTGVGLSDFGIGLNRDRPILKSEVTTGSQNPHFSGETDSNHTLTGSGDGVPASGSSAHPEKWGYTSTSGTSIMLDDTPGGESISLNHHSGASVKIDPDGAVYITSSSRKGIGFSAPYGDAYMSASGDIVITGSSLSFQTSGDCNLVVGGTYNIKCSGYKLTTDVMDETIDGSASRSITNDNVTIVGGINRTSVAGDQRVQVSGNNIKDVGGNNTSSVSGNSTDSTTGTKTIASTGDLIVSSSGKTTVAAGGDAKLSATGNMDVFGSSAKLSASGGVSVEASGSATLVGSTATVGGSTVNIATGTLAAPFPSGGGGSASPSPSSATSPTEVKKAEVLKGKDIVDQLTSVRKYPDYPRNAKLESADSGSINTASHEGDSTGKKVYDEYSSKNTGTSNPVTTENYGTIPDIAEGERSTDIQGVEPGISVPSRHNSSAMISRYFTLGQLINAKHSHPIPSSSYEKIVQNHIYLAYNVLDKIKEKFPDIIITSVYRPNSKNHITGFAVDLVVPSRRMDLHAEIARYARDNLPVSQVFLEKNTSGRSHVHLKATKGQEKPRTLTCGDPQCVSKTEGIDIEYLTRAGSR